MPHPEIRTFGPDRCTLPVYRPLARHVADLCSCDEIRQEETLPLIRSDMGLALAFLQDTCPSGGVFSMDLAADTLGPDGLRAFLLVSVSDFLDEPAAPENFPLEAFWKHGALCRFLAHELASHLQMDYPELAGLAGLLHDIGKYILFQKRPTRYEAIHTTVREQDMAWSQAEKREFGIDHAVAGRLFLEQTPLPPSVVEAVWLHHHNIHDAADRSPDIAGCVYLANVLAHQPPFENNGRPRDRSRYTRLCDRFGLSERSIEELVNRGSRFLSDLIASFPEAVPDAGTLEALRSRARKTLQRHIIVTQTIRRDGEKQNEAGTALCETARRLAFLPDSASILDAVAEAARKTLALDAVSIEFHDAGGTVYRKTAGHGEAGDGVTLHTTLITAQTWGRGALIAVGSPHTERPDIKEWMSRFGEVAETALILFYRHYRLQTLADRLADAYPAENATPEPRDAEDRLRDLNSMAARMAHLFNNLFAGMLGRTQLLLKRPDTPEKTIAGLQNIEQTVLKATRVIQLLQIASQPEPARLTDAVDLEETIREVLETHMPAMDAASIAVDLERMETVPEITGRREEIRLMLEQILLNSMEAMPAGGTISLASTATEQGVQITARDTGTGIPEDIIPFIFDPLFTTRGPQSLGLGLSLARSVMTRHRGTLEVVSGPEGGVSVIMKFPVESTSVDGVNKTGATMTANGSSKI